MRFFLEATSADMQVWTLKDGGLKIEAQADSFHGKDKPVLDLRNGGDKFPIPSGVESAHRLLDQSIGLADRRVYRGGESDRTCAIMRRERADATFPPSAAILRPSVRPPVQQRSTIAT